MATMPKDRPLELLLVEDNPGDARLVRETLRGRGAGHWAVTHCASLEASGRVVVRGRFDAALVDLSLPDAVGVEAVEALLAADGRLPILVLTGTEDEETAALAMQRGAQDYLFKRLLPELPLDHLVRNAVERQRLRREVFGHLRQVERQQEQLSALLAGLPDGVLVVGSPGETIRFANAAASQLLGQAPEALVGQGFAHELPPGDAVELQLPGPAGAAREVEARPSPLHWHGEPATVITLRDVTASRRAEREKTELVRQLREALSQVKVLTGLLPICMYCKQIRDEVGSWQPLEGYIHQRSEAQFSHGLCPACARQHYPEIFPPEG